MTEWKNRIIGIENVDPKTITMHPSNYRTHPDHQQKMMGGVFEDIGWIQAVIVNKQTGNLIDGHMRVELAIRNNEAEIPVIFIDVDPEEEGKILATFDPITGFAKEEKDKLAEIISSVQSRSDDLNNLIKRVANRNKIDFGPDDLEKQEKETKEEKREREEEERQSLVAQWEVEKGQLWVIPSKSVGGFEHRLMCGDSADRELVTYLMNGKKAALMVTDPPYGCDFDKKYNPKSKDWEKIDNDDKKGDQLKDWFIGILDIWSENMNENSSYYVWSGVFEEGFAIYHAMKEQEIHIQGQIVWAKNAFSLGQTDYHWQHENAWYGFRKGKKIKHVWNGGRDQSTLWEVHKVSNQDYLHPNQKPTELYSIPIQNHTRSGEICAEPFCGSGSQIVAAEQYGRLCYAMESDPVWVATTLDRLSRIGLTPKLDSKV
jgi:DNA modification methylase